MLVIRFLLAITTAIAKVALIFSPALLGAVWIYAGESLWMEFGGWGLACWDLPTLSGTLYLPWSRYRATRDRVDTLSLSQDELMKRFEETGRLPIGFSFFFAMIAMELNSITMRSRWYRTLLIVSSALFVFEVALLIFCSWIATGLVFGSFLGVAGVCAGLMIPFLLFWHWVVENDRLVKAHPEPPGGT